MYLTNFHFYNPKNTHYSKPIKGLHYYGLGYRFSFNGQEKDDEISGAGNTMTATFWEYDSRLGRRFNRDPKPNPSISDYACFNNNPILLVDCKGDSSVINGTGDVLFEDTKDLRVFQIIGKEYKLIGEIGKTLDLTKTIDNLLAKNKEKAKGMDIADFVNAVQGGNEWDYKANKKTIFGLAWSIDLKNSNKDEDKNTHLKWHQHTFQDASDFGNFHFGYVGKNIYGGAGLPNFVLTRGAAFIEIKKDLGDLNVLDAVIGAHLLILQIPPYGDEPDDHFYVNFGMAFDEAQKKTKKN